MGERQVKVVVQGEDKGGAKALEGVEKAAAAVVPSSDKASKALAGVEKAASSVVPSSDTASKALAGVEKVAASVAPSASKADTALGQLTTSMTSRLPAGGAQAKAALDKVGGSLLSGVENASKLELAVTGLAVVGGAALAKFASDGIGHFVSATAEVRKLKATLGDTAEEASGLRNVAIGLGVDTDTLAKGMFKLVGNVQAAKGELAGVHVEIAQGKSGNVDYGKTLDNLRAAYQSLTDPASKNQFLLEAFKKTGMDLRPILSATNDEFERMKKSGPIFSDKDLQAGREFSISQRELGEATKTLEVDLARGLVPAITTATDLLTSGVQAADRLHVPLVQLGIAAGTTALALRGLAAAEGEAGLGMLGTVGIYGAGAVAAKHNADETINLIAQHEKHKGVLGVLDSILGAHVGTTEKAAKADSEAAKAKAQHAADTAKLQVQTERLGISLSDEEVATGKVSAEHQKAISAIEGYSTALETAYAATGASSQELYEQSGKVAHGFYEARTAADSLKTGLDILTGAHVSAQRAAIDEEAKVKALTDALNANGLTLDITTEKGRANQSAILDLITATGNLATSMTQEGDTNEQVTATYTAHIEQLRGVLRAAGLTEDQIQGLIDKYHLVPGAVATDVSAPGAGAAADEVAGLHGELNALPSYKEVRIVTYEETHKDIYGTGSYGPGYASGGIGEFGAGTLAVLHGREAVLPLDDPARSMALLLDTGLVKTYAQGGVTYDSPADRVRTMAAAGPWTGGSSNWTGEGSPMVLRIEMPVYLDGRKVAENTRDHLIDMRYTLGDPIPAR